MLHYHVMWGSITVKTPKVLDFNDAQEAIDKFIEIGQKVEAEENFVDLPSTCTEYELPNMWVARLLTDKTRICYCVCNNECSIKPVIDEQLN